MNVEARIHAKGKRFEILVDSELAKRMRNGENIPIETVLQTDTIFTDIKKGLRASSSDIKSFFGTDDLYAVAEKIIKTGDIQTPVAEKKKELENKYKQIIEFLSKNAVDPRTGKPHTPERIEKALDESGVNVTNKPIEQQISEIIDKIRTLLPIKIETKKLRIKIPANYTGIVYGLIHGYKEKEDWKNDGTLEVTVNIPIGIQMEFYDKLNSITHGSTIVEEIK